MNRIARHRGKGHQWAAVAALAAALGVLMGAAACGGTQDAGTQGAGTQEAATQEGGTQGGTQEAEPTQLEIAMIVGSAANAYQAAIIDAAKETAAELGAEITVYDSQFDAAKAIGYLEDVLSLGKSRFDGIAFLPLDNVAPLDQVKKVISEGWVIGVANGIIGPRLDTGEPQVDGLAVQAVTVWTDQGVKMAKLISMACEGIDPCKVGWAAGLKLWPAEQLMLDTIDAELQKSPNVHMDVRLGDTGYTREGGLEVISGMIQTHPDLHVIAAADQALLGAETALEEAGMLGTVKLIGWGGTTQSVERIKDGRWFGTLGTSPVAEGTFLIEGVVQMIRTGESMGFVDTTAGLPDAGVITAANVDQYKPEWAG